MGFSTDVHATPYRMHHLVQVVRSFPSSNNNIGRPRHDDIPLGDRRTVPVCIQRKDISSYILRSLANSLGIIRCCGTGILALRVPALDAGM